MPCCFVERGVCFPQTRQEIEETGKRALDFSGFPSCQGIGGTVFFFFFRNSSVCTNGKDTLTRILNLYYVMRLRLPALALTSGNRKRLTTVRHRIWFDILKGSSQTLKCCRAIKLQFFGQYLRYVALVVASVWLFKEEENKSSFFSVYKLFETVHPYDDCDL